MRVHCPVADGSGAYIIHKMLADSINDYHVCAYNPWLTAFPPALYMLCRRGRPDLVHTTPDYSVFSKRRNIPLVITFHGYELDKAMRKFSSPLQRLHFSTDLKWLTQRAVACADTITAVSHYTAELVSRDLGLDKPVRVIYNGVDESRFTPEQRNRDNASTVKVLFSGNLKLRKGANLIPGIVERLNPGIELIYTTGLRSRQQLPEHPALKCVGRVPHASMPQLYNTADILLFPTVREGFGLAAAEAMACGLPVVATNCSALPELVDHGMGGYLCTPDDAAAFANSINQLADSASLRSEMGEYNRSKIEQQFTARRMVQAYTELFEETLDKR